MKTKKALAVILAVVMTITLIPSMAFATSDSTVKAVPTVAANDEMPEISINIEVKDKEWTTDDVQTVKFTFKNAKWTTNPTEGKIADASTVAGFMEVSNNATLKEIVSVTDESVEFTFVPSSTLAKGQVITVDFPEGALTSGSDDGAVEIAIDGQDSYVSTKTLTVATVGSSNTTASVNGSVKTFGRVSNVAVGTKIEIRETAVNSITTDQVLKLTLPKGVSWDSVTLSGNLAATGNAMRTSVASADAVNGVGDYYLGNDGRSVYIFVDVTDEKATRQVLGITGEITIGKNAAEGDITVDVTSYRAFNSGNSISSCMIFYQDIHIWAYSIPDSFYTFFNQGSGFRMDRSL